MTLIAALLALVVGAGLAYMLARKAAPDASKAAQIDAERQTMLHTLDMMRQQQSELTGRLANLAEAQETARGELSRTMTEQLGNVFKTVNENLKESREKTTRSLGDLGERLQIIDKAQQEITAL